ncbi:MAG TPA: type II secretion system protein [Tepidisphaeraceae bacterium]|nr:type II secretion system protein [Tepidisphaeraceae bacterium]
MRRARRGFTLLEVLAVMGIMLILIGMAVIGFEKLDRTASGKQTRALLTECNAMLNEFEAEGGAAGLQGLGPGGPSTQSPYPGGVGGPLGGSGIEISSVNSGSADRYGTAVINTWYVMANLMRVPKVKEMIEKLPSNRILTNAGSGSGGSGPWYPSNLATGLTSNSGVVLLDAWGNPIIFVPSGGIYVWKNGQGNNRTLITSPDGLPFFASAGPDGDFGGDSGNSAPSNPTGDDNIYSFENGQ